MKSDRKTALAQWFARSGYTQKAFAAQIGITEAAVSLLVNGLRTPSLQLAIRISNETGIAPADLIGKSNG